VASIVGGEVSKVCATLITGLAPLLAIGNLLLVRGAMVEYILDSAFILMFRIICIIFCIIVTNVDPSRDFVGADVLLIA